MFRHLFLSASFCILFSACTDKDTPAFSSSDFKIGNDLFSSNNVISNENCNSLFLTIDNKDSKAPYFIEAELTKSGEIIKMRVANKNENYESTLFDPKHYIQISSFHYDSLSKSLTFSLEGTLFKPYTAQSINIKADINKVLVKPTSCSDLLNNLRGDLISSLGSKATFYSTMIVSEKNQSSLYNYFYSNSGFRVSFQLDENFVNLPEGSYAINSSSPYKIVFEKYLGLSDVNNFYLFKNTEWQTYKVEEKFDIVRHTALANRKKYTAGSLVFTAYDNKNNITYQFTNGNFIIAN